MVLPHKDFYLLLVVLRPNYHIVVSSLQKQDLGEKRRAFAWYRGLQSLPYPLEVVGNQKH